MKHFFCTYSIFIALALASCQSQKEELLHKPLADYMPLQIGKYITYRLDSTVFTQANSKTEIHKYQVKHTVLQETTDNLGRKTYIINRLLNNENASGPWVENGTYTITPLADRVETVDNNLRVVVLQSPIVPGFSWKGNSYLPQGPYQSLHRTEAAGVQMNRWNFTYTTIADTSIAGTNYSEVCTVLHNDYVLNFPVTPATTLAVKEVAEEKYAKNVGLVYKNFQLYEYQKSNADNPQPSYTGFGITLWAIAHN